MVNTSGGEAIEDQTHAVLRAEPGDRISNGASQSDVYGCHCG